MTIKWIQEGSSINLLGDLTYANITVIYEKFFDWLKNRQSLKINFSEVQVIDSAGVALLINWYRYANRMNKAIKYTNLTDKLDDFLVDKYLRELFQRLQK